LFDLQKMANFGSLSFTVIERALKPVIESHALLTCIEFEHVSRRGKPAEVIVDFARKRSIDLIVMGTHGKTGLARVVVGSVAQNVMANAPCPVVTVKMPAKQNRRL